MRQVQDAAAPTAGREGATRRDVLGAGLACALPLMAGVGLTKGGFFAAAQEAAVGDPVLEFLSGEVARTYREVQGPLGLRGEHARRLASAADLLAVHMRSTGMNLTLDEEVRRSVEGLGAPGAALDVIDRLRSHAISGLRPPLPRAVQDPVRMEAALDEVRQRGSSQTIRSWRPRLERLAVIIDRQREDDASVRVVHAATQKPGDDFLGLPDPPGIRGEDLCQMLEAMIISCNLLSAVTALGGAAPLAAFLQAMAGILELTSFITCKAVLE